MEEEKSVLQWKKTLLPFLESKAEELKVMGYDKTKPEDVWDCLMKKVWKKEKNLRLHQAVQDVMHLSTQIFMSYLTMKAYESNDLFAQIRELAENVPE
ncbi:post-transcriptional regulator [Bacillaceae bacterium S4-13-58]